MARISHAFSRHRPGADDLLRELPAGHGVAPGDEVPCEQRLREGGFLEVGRERGRQLGSAIEPALMRQSERREQLPGARVGHPIPASLASAATCSVARASSSDQVPRW